MTWKLIETCIAAIKTTFSNIENIERDEDWFEGDEDSQE